jgi:ribosomal protein S27AE
MYEVSAFIELLLTMAASAVVVVILYAIRYFYIEKHRDCPKCGTMWSLSLSDGSKGPFSEQLMPDGLSHRVRTHFETYSCSHCGYREEKESLVIYDD